MVNKINLESALPVFQSIHLAAGETLDEITYRPELLEHPALENWSNGCI